MHGENVKLVQISFAPRRKQKITHNSTFHNRPDSIPSFGISEDFSL